MPVQGVEPLREGIAAQVSMPRGWLWTWGGVCFGYRQEEWLFTYDGIGVGRFVGSEIYGTSGKYLGELRGTGQGQRLTTSSYNKSRVVAAFSPKVEGAYERPANRLPQTLYCGYQDFPSPEILKVEVGETLHSRSAISSVFDTKRKATPSPQPNGHTGAQTVATLDQQVSQAERAVVVDANALAELFDTTEPYNDTCGSENAASSESNPIISGSNLTPIITLGKSGDETDPSQADQRAEHLRQLFLDISSRTSQRRMRSSAASLIRTAETNQFCGSVDGDPVVRGLQATLLKGGAIEKTINDQPFEAPGLQISMPRDLETPARMNRAEFDIERPPLHPRFRNVLLLLVASLPSLAVILLGFNPSQKAKLEHQYLSAQKSLEQSTNTGEDAPSSVKSSSSSQMGSNDSVTNHAEVKALEPSWISGVADGSSLLGSC